MSEQETPVGLSTLSWQSAESGTNFIRNSIALPHMLNRTRWVGDCLKRTMASPHPLQGFICV